MVKKKKVNFCCHPHTVSSQFYYQWDAYYIKNEVFYSAVWFCYEKKSIKLQDLRYFIKTLVQWNCILAFKNNK